MKPVIRQQTMIQINDLIFLHKCIIIYFISLKQKGFVTRILRDQGINKREGFYMKRKLVFCILIISMFITSVPMNVLAEGESEIINTAEDTGSGPDGEEMTDDAESVPDAQSVFSEDEIVLEIQTAPQISILSRDIAEGTAVFSISDVKLSDDDAAVIVPVWSREDQSDIYWYTAEKSDDGSYLVNMNISNHNYHYGTYNADVYERSKEGSYVYLCGTTASFEITPGVSDAERIGAGEKYHLETHGFTVPKNIDEVYMAVWSEEGGQDDLTWNRAEYDAGEALLECDFDTSNLKHTEIVFAHAYAHQKDGTMIYLGGQEFRYSGNYCKEIQITDKDNNKGTCRVTLTGVEAPDGIMEILVPVWSLEDQSDIYWYVPTRQADGTYTFILNIANHAGLKGLYYIDVYIHDGTDALEYAGGSETLFEQSEVPAMDEVFVSVVKNGSVWRITAENAVVSYGIYEIKAAVWTDEGWQDDLTWINGVYDPGTATITAELQELKLLHTGKAYVDIYVVGDDKVMRFLSGTTFETGSYARNTAVFPDNASGSFTVLINGKALPAGTKSIMVPVWSRNDQSDIVWYNAQRKSDGNYEVISSIARHNYNTGKYYTDVYTVNSKGIYSFLDGQTMNFSVKNDGLTVEQTGSRFFGIRVKGVEVPAGAASVMAAVWSEAGGQDDLIWYQTSGTNGGDYTATADIARHRTEGMYYTDVYARTKSGEMIFLGGSTDINIQTNADAVVSFAGGGNSQGTFDIIVNISGSTCGISSLSVPVWCSSDQSDIIWYSAVRQNENTWRVKVDVNNHKAHFGNYHIHMYATFENGIFKFLGGTAKLFETEAFLSVSQPDGSYGRRLTFHGASAESASFAVWSLTGGQDDIIWYDGIKGSDGNFYADVRLSNHKHNGTFIVHVYTDNGFATDGSFSMIDYVEYAIAIAYNDSVGYSQVNRYLNPDVDCSSLVYYSLYNSGFARILGSSPFYTGSQVNLMQRCGFSVYNYTGMDALRPGDVLWYRYGSSGHTEIYIGNGYTVGAHDSVVNGIDYPQGGDQTGHEVSVSPFAARNWIYVLRIYE